MNMTTYRLLDKYNLQNQVQKLIDTEVEKRVQKAILDAKEKLC